MATTETSALAALSNDIASTIERVASGVVAVEGRARIGFSGFYIKPDLILTADHALESDEIEIVRANGETATATVAGRDPSTDLALLRVQNPGVPLEFASPEALRVGAIVLAVARDDDGDLAATMGVISAVGDAWRTWHGGEIDRFVRPDLSLYPRFSGSPLVDVTGRVIGLNTGGLSRRQTLTVPATTIERVVEALLTRGGRIPRGYLGVALQGVQGGVIVLGVEPNSPADRGGLIVGDIIVALGGKAVEDADDVHAQLGAGTVGKQLALDVRRGGSPHQVQVTVGERPEHD
ncbi:MAG TPA: trypsin-like peptidase domain-containing protein [Candidatus Elarobacter sp.]|nr:trypsin-like peptidase domain-containing protein [Candidatus Elarobacter sp.]HEV2740049.1 trypsin-like peptidase domain-containing protein [Candidatus Elarobacter sp.]